MTMRLIKSVVVGDGMVGKTCLLKCYSDNVFPTEYVPTVFDNFEANLLIDEVPVTLQLSDSAGQETYDRIRPLMYPGTDVLLIAFSIVSPDSYLNVKVKWKPEVAHHCPGVPIVLVGTKLDLRDDPEANSALTAAKTAPVSNAQGRTLAREIGAAAYVECSAMRHENVNEVFERAVRCVLRPGSEKQGKPKRRCLMI